MGDSVEVATMECGICNVRSSVGFCVQCKTLLCEECATTCEHCGKLMCEKHVYQTTHGRDLCIECMEERNQKRAQHKKRRESKHGHHEEDEDVTFEGLHDHPDEEEEEGTRVISGYRATPPWLLSVYTAGGGLVVLAIVLFFPALAALAQPWMSIITFFLAGVAIFWAVLGLRDEKYAEDKPKCYYGLGVAGLVICLAVVILFIRQVRLDEDAVEVFEYSLGDLRRELEDRREQTLDRFE